jgi:hypothetical protein
MLSFVSIFLAGGSIHTRLGTASFAGSAEHLSGRSSSGFLLGDVQLEHTLVKLCVHLLRVRKERGIKNHASDIKFIRRLQPTQYE